MGKRLKISGQLSVEELEARYRQASDGVGRSQWQIIWLLASGQGTEVVTENDATVTNGWKRTGAATSAILQPNARYVSKS